MNGPRDIDGLLVQWGDRLFYPGNRIVPGRRPPRLRAGTTRERAAWLRERIEATVVRRAPQVMVKVTGGGRNMRAIVAHLRYISKNGRLDIEDERGQVERGKAGMHAIADDWRLGGSRIPDDGAPGQGRREAFNIILSMPRGTDPLTVLRAAREFAQAELADHKIAMVLHDHQANPHVHLSVRAESRHGRRLNPRKADLQRWRETFAEKLRGWGVEAEATRQATRARCMGDAPLWRLKARAEGRLHADRTGSGPSARGQATRSAAIDAWVQIGNALRQSASEADRALAKSVDGFVRGAVDALSRDRSTPSHARRQGHVRAVEPSPTR